MRLRQFDISISEAVRQHPCLYDRSDSNFNEKEYVSRCWDDVAIKCGLQNGDLAHRAFDNLRKRYNKVKGKYHIKDPSDPKEHESLEIEVAAYSFIHWLDPFIHRRRAKREMEELYEGECSMVDRSLISTNEDNMEVHDMEFASKGEKESRPSDESVFSEDNSNTSPFDLDTYKQETLDCGREENTETQVQIQGYRSLSERRIPNESLKHVVEVFQSSANGHIPSEKTNLGNHTEAHKAIGTYFKHEHHNTGVKRKFHNRSSHNQMQHKVGVAYAYQGSSMNLQPNADNVTNIQRGPDLAVHRNDTPSTSMLVSTSDLASFDENDLLVRLLTKKLNKLPKRLKLKCENELMQTLLKYELLAEEESINDIPKPDS